jgi:hypothetical protein
MSGNIANILSQMTQYSEALSTASNYVRFGGVGFRDGVAVTQTLTDVDHFKTFLSSLTATGGGDANEGGLLALRTAIAHLDADDPTPGSIKAIFYFTDNPAHNGGPENTPAIGTSRDCSLNVTLDALRNRDQAAFGPVNFFYSVATMGGQACGGYAQASDQMAALLAAYPFPNSDNSLPFPVTKASLDALRDKLIALPAPEIEICLAKTADFYRPDGWVAKWSADSMADVYEAFQSKKPMEYSMDKDITVAGSYQSVVYSCFAPSDVLAGDFSHGEDQAAVQQDIDSGPPES